MKNYLKILWCVSIYVTGQLFSMNKSPVVHRSPKQIYKPVFRPTITTDISKIEINEAQYKEACLLVQGEFESIDGFFDPRCIQAVAEALFHIRSIRSKFCEYHPIETNRIHIYHNSKNKKEIDELVKILGGYSVSHTILEENNCTSVSFKENLNFNLIMQEFNRIDKTTTTERVQSWNPSSVQRKLSFSRFRDVNTWLFEFEEVVIEKISKIPQDKRVKFATRKTIIEYNPTIKIITSAALIINPKNNKE